MTTNDIGKYFIGGNEMTSCNNEGRTCKLLKSVMGITMSAAILATNLTCAMAQGNEYPYSSDFPNGIEDADISVFTESEIEYPLNMSFETNEEIEFVKANSQDEQISLSEDAYEGRFALDVKPASDERLLVKKPETLQLAKQWYLLLYTA